MKLFNEINFLRSNEIFLFNTRRLFFFSKNMYIIYWITIKNDLCIDIYIFVHYRKYSMLKFHVISSYSQFNYLNVQQPME